eukprot:scaffold196603_cov15-Prasinocladus_malaysianus.AAC.1
MHTVCIPTKAHHNDSEAKKQQAGPADGPWDACTGFRNLQAFEIAPFVAIESANTQISARVSVASPPLDK